MTEQIDALLVPGLAVVAAGSLVAIAGRLPLRVGTILPAVLGAGTVGVLLGPAPLPRPVLLTAQLLVGAVIGARVGSARLGAVRRWLPAHSAALLAVLATSAAAALLLARTTGLDRTTALLAMVPGGAADISVVAVSAVGPEAATVVGVQLLRQLIVVGLVAGVVRMLSTPPDVGVARTVRTSAGAVVFRDTTDGERQVLLVHRPTYDDWSLPKGAVETGESAEAAALREVLEETGWSGRIVAQLGSQHYRERSEAPTLKHVEFFAVAAERFDGVEVTSEIDGWRWVPAEEAGAVMSRPQDRRIIARFLEDPIEV